MASIEKPNSHTNKNYALNQQIQLLKETLPQALRINKLLNSLTKSINVLCSSETILETLEMLKELGN